MQVCTTIAGMRAARAALGPHATLGFVPTMGALHDGHMSLVAQAAARSDAVAACFFVNPLQFGAGEDLDRYPRPIEADLARLEAAGVALAFCPSVDELYPAGFSSRIEVGPIGDRLEGAARPGHFAGVATVVAKLFNIVRPDVAWFGQKDAQQTLVIRRLVRDLDMGVAIAIAPTVREADGLALSSRNIYLDPGQRAEATSLHRGLQAAAAAHAAGERGAAALRALVTAPIAATSGRIDYVSVADAETLAELDEVGPAGALVSLAVRFGATRLIDNLRL